MQTLLKRTLTLLIIVSGLGFSDTDGPDYFKVKGVVSNDVLNIRSKANYRAKKVGEIPPAANCVKNLGCKGGLTMREYTELSKKAQAAILRKRPRWCHVEYHGVKGWVSARYLTEGECPKLY